MPKCDFNKLQSNFIEIILWHGCSPVNSLHIFRTAFLKNTSGWLLLSNILGRSCKDNTKYIMGLYYSRMRSRK